MKQTKLTIAIPASPGSEIIVSLTGGQVTDRAQRYRANDVLGQLAPDERTRCHFCGASDRPLMAGHVDGHEENSDPANISPTCRPCNNAMAATFAAVGAGRRTRQYNPQAAAPDAAAYRAHCRTLHTAASITALQTAIAAVHATPHAKRDAWAGPLK